MGSCWHSMAATSSPSIYGLLETPKSKGTVQFKSGATPGWARDGNFADPRTNHLGNLPRDWAHIQEAEGHEPACATDPGHGAGSWRCARDRAVAVGAGGTNLLTITNYVVITNPPPPVVAAFTADPTNGVAPLTVYFTNLSSGAMDYAWDFGDGGVSTEINPANTYTNAGTYTVSLVAVGAGLLSTFKVDTTLGLLLGYQVLVGVGSGMTAQVSNIYPFLTVRHPLLPYRRSLRCKISRLQYPRSSSSNYLVKQFSSPSPNPYF